MQCDYKDDFKVDYSGTLRITKGNGVSLTIQGSQIPSDFRTRLDAAVTQNDCHQLRTVAKQYTNTIHQAFDRE